jgi:hypothetical protein
LIACASIDLGDVADRYSRRAGDRIDHAECARKDQHPDEEGVLMLIMPRSSYVADTRIMLGGNVLRLPILMKATV